MIELRGDDEARYLEAVLSEENPNKCRELYPALRKAGDDIAEAEKDYIKKLEALDDDDEDGEDGETSNQLTLIVVFKYK
ncbi:MAG: hypothetical protein J5449_09460 [Oscillospiraceae bacterium]|nr:hypothetical protein [Oscillospiraceae bacterium]